VQADSTPGNEVPPLAIPYPPGLSWRVAEDEPVPNFTARQKEIGAWLAEGLTDAEIADKLDIGVETVKAHVSDLLARTRKPARTRLMAWIWRNRTAFEVRKPGPDKPVKYK
jgi:DNA-binding CsgD family transcriptional regulator